MEEAQGLSPRLHYVQEGGGEDEEEKARECEMEQPLTKELNPSFW